MATIINKMNPINTIAELENLINSGSQLIWFSKSFQCGFKIDFIDRSTYSFNFIKCRFESGQHATIKLNDIYSIKFHPANAGFFYIKNPDHGNDRGTLNQLNEQSLDLIQHVNDVGHHLFRLRQLFFVVKNPLD